MPKTYILSFKTHKLTVLTTVTQPDRKTIADLKEEALSALTSDVVANPHVEVDIGLPEVDPQWEVPQVTSVDDFELCKAVKERGRPTGQYEPLSPDATVKQSVPNWESLYIQFKNKQGRPIPVKVSLPAIEDEDEDEAELSAARKGKRKAGPEDPLSDY
ncbi:hypothetical protein EIP86_003910 [Pleurotus ostreatoroseus]|nr:hypothetical protein EIP86_003910 [Pleurotus ostreatoroseus]